MSPGFEWPDEPFEIRAVQLMGTGAPALAWLNRILVVQLGAVNYGTRRLAVEAYAFGPSRHAGNRSPASSDDRLSTRV